MVQKTWKPEPRQADFISIPDNVFEAMFGGAAGGGKSETLLMLPIVRQFYNYPRWKGIIMRRTFPELEREIILRSHDYYPASGARYNEQKRRWQWPSGAIMQFGYAEHDKDVRSYDTSEFPYMAFDELTSFSQFQYEYLAFSRCRSSDSNLPAIVRSGTNPGNIGHNFVRARFVEPCPRGNTLLREVRKVDGKDVTLYRIFIPSKYIDNSHIMTYDPTYAARLDLLPDADRKAKKDGDWWVFDGQVFDEWRLEPLSDEPTNARHVISPFPIPSYWPRVLSIDWGYSAMMCAGWYAINPIPTEQHPAKIYKYREYTSKKEKISTWASNLRRLTTEDLADIVLDPSAWGNRGDELTLAEQFGLAFEQAARKADNDRVGGKELLQEYLRWHPRPPKRAPEEGYNPDIASRIQRMRGEKAFLDYAALFQPEAVEQFLPKFQVFETCEKTIETIPICVYDKTKKEDVQEFNGDDPYDETRYGLKACQQFLDGGQPEAILAAQIARAEELLMRTGNMTEYYHRMDKIENQVKGPVGIRRGGHRARGGFRRIARN